MPRWDPDAANRLAIAALDLFTQHGYENTTVAQIAERAGLTKSTFFRHFKDKREALFSADAINQTLTEGIASAPASADPLQAVAHALDLVGTRLFPSERRHISLQRQAVINAHSELREREALKSIDLAAEIEAALQTRGVSKLRARVTAELGSLALAIIYERWADGEHTDFTQVAQKALIDVRDALVGL